MLSSFWDREPALIVGSIVTIGVNIVAVLAGEGLISDVAAGQATDLAQSAGALVVSLLPIITAILIRPVVSPATK